MACREARRERSGVMARTDARVRTPHHVVLCFSFFLYSLCTWRCTKATDPSTPLRDIMEGARYGSREACVRGSVMKFFAGVHLV